MQHQIEMPKANGFHTLTTFRRVEMNLALYADFSSHENTVISVGIWASNQNECSYKENDEWILPSQF